MELEENFIEYKDITLTVIKAVKAGEYEKLEEIFEQRQLILDNINKGDPSKDELKSFYLKYEIKSLEKALSLEMKIRKKNILIKIKNTDKKQRATAGYNKISAKAVFLSKEV